MGNSNIRPVFCINVENVVNLKVKKKKHCEILWPLLTGLLLSLYLSDLENCHLIYIFEVIKVLNVWWDNKSY